METTPWWGQYFSINRETLGPVFGRKGSAPDLSRFGGGPVDRHMFGERHWREMVGIDAARIPATVVESMLSWDCVTGQSVGETMHGLVLVDAVAVSILCAHPYPAFA
jgi:hypothetical protein